MASRTTEELIAQVKELDRIIEALRQENKRIFDEYNTESKILQTLTNDAHTRRDKAEQALTKVEDERVKLLKAVCQLTEHLQEDHSNPYD